MYYFSVLPDYYGSSTSTFGQGHKLVEHVPVIQQRGSTSSSTHHALQPPSLPSLPSHSQLYGGGDLGDPLSLGRGPGIGMGLGGVSASCHSPPRPGQDWFLLFPFMMITIIHFLFMSFFYILLLFPSPSSFPPSQAPVAQ